MELCLIGSGDFPDTDDIISVTSEKVSTIDRPGQAVADGDGGLLGANREFGSNSSQLFLLVHIVESDAGGGGNGKDVGGRREGDVGNFVIEINVEVLKTGGEIPDEDLTVLTSRSTDGTVGRDSNLVDELGMADEVVFDLHGIQTPNLHNLIVTAGNNAGGFGGRNEADTAHPIIVTLLVESVLAFTESVPELDAAITTAGHDQTVIGGEAHGKDVLVVTNQGLFAFAGSQVPETDGVIPGSRESVLTIEGDANVLDNVRMAMERSDGSTVGQNERGIFNEITGTELPKHTGLVARRSDDGVSIGRRRGNRGDPTVVTSKATTKTNLGRHFLLKGISDRRIKINSWI